ncbi:hypothetical protein ABN584_27485 [Gloeocapsa sp. BRSZ]
MQKVIKLKTKQELLTTEQAEHLEAQLKLFPQNLLPEHPRRVLLNTLYHLKNDGKAADGWVFTMIGRKQVMALTRAIAKLPPSLRPHQTLETFIYVLANMRQDTGEVTLTRDQLGEALEIRSENISHIMRTLEKLGIIRREYHKISGMRGRGMVVYFVNPDVAWNGSLATRKIETERTQQQFNLHLIQGGVSGEVNAS